MYAYYVCTCTLICAFIYRLLTEVENTTQLQARCRFTLIIGCEFRSLL